MWGEALAFFFECITCEYLELESFSNWKRRLMIERYGDLRIEYAKILEHFWNSMETFQPTFLVRATNIFLKGSLIMQKELSKIFIKLYIDIVLKEIEESKDYTVVFGRSIEAFDDSSTTGVEVEFFTQNFFQLFDLSSCPHKEITQKFLSETKTILGYFHEIKTLPPRIEYEDERISATIKLMEFLYSKKRLDLYIAYVHSLVDIHVQSQNFQEAGGTLMLHANLLKWSNDTASALLDFKEEMEWERKEMLTFKIVEYFDSGQLWEKAIQCLNEMSPFYQSIYAYEKLSYLSKMLSELYSKLSTQERFFSTFFKVGYYGKKYPENYRNQEYIFKGKQFERLQEFTDSIKLKFPNARLLQKTEVTEEDKNSDEQLLLITAVTPCFKEEMSQQSFPASLKNAPQNVLKYYQNNDVNIFLYNKSFFKEKPLNKNDQVEEFKKLWLMKTFYVTEEFFPSFVRRTKVCKVVRNESSPIQNSVSSVKEKNDELQLLLDTIKLDISQNRTQLEDNIKSLTRALNGIIDAAVNGGTKIYRLAFITPQYKKENPKDVSMVEQLNNSLLEQMDILEEALFIHGTRCHSDILPMQTKLEDFFEKLQQDMRSINYQGKPYVKGLPASRRVQSDPSSLKKSKSNVNMIKKKTDKKIKNK